MIRSGPGLTLNPKTQAGAVAQLQLSGTTSVGVAAAFRSGKILFVVLTGSLCPCVHPHATYAMSSGETTTA